MFKVGDEVTIRCVVTRVAPQPYYTCVDVETKVPFTDNDDDTRAFPTKLSFNARQIETVAAVATPAVDG